MKWLGLLLLSLVIARPGVAADYYVNNTQGRDANPGTTPEQAVATFARAVKLLQPGDTLHVARTDQPYREALRINGRSGTPRQPIVIEGNDAIISGLEDTPLAHWQPQADGTWRYQFTHGKLAPNCCPVLQADDVFIPVQRGDAPLAAGHYSWADGWLTYRPAGAAPAKLAVSARDCGVALHDASYVTVRHLISEGHYNDGFNGHDNCQGLLFEHVEARYNGDDGFSVHEDIGVTFRASVTHHNHFGIADINASQSDYVDVLIADNQCGVMFSGGVHRLVDCEIRDNLEYQVVVKGGVASGGRYGTATSGPLYAGTCFVRNTRISGGPVGVMALGSAQVLVMGCTISGCATGVRLRGSSVELRASTVTDCAQAVIETTAKGFVQGFNTFATGKFVVDGKSFTAAEWPDFLAAIASTDNGSTVAPPPAPAAGAK